MLITLYLSNFLVSCPFYKSNSIFNFRLLNITNASVYFTFHSLSYLTIFVCRLWIFFNYMFYSISYKMKRLLFIKFIVTNRSFFIFIWSISYIINSWFCLGFSGCGVINPYKLNFNNKKNSIKWFSDFQHVFYHW